MNTRWVPRTHHSKGFTIVELLVVIVIIGTLSAITVVAYNGVQRSAIAATLRSDLNGAAKIMSATHMRVGAYPDVLPPEIIASPGITLTLANLTTGGYSGLSPVQNGVLFQHTCQQLVTEGFGTGTNIVNQIEQYITGCHVYNNNAMQINGWSARDFPTSIAQTTVHNWYNTNITSDAWRPNKKTVFLDFANELSTRFVALGGVFPVTSFWDPWANSSNGGVMLQPLPAPNAPSDPRTYCIEGSHVTYTDVLFHMTNQGVIKEGLCP